MYHRAEKKEAVKQLLNEQMKLDFHKKEKALTRTTEENLADY